MRFRFIIRQRFLTLACAAFALVASFGLAQEKEPESDGILLSRQTLAARVREIQKANDLTRFASQEDWTNACPRLQSQLLEMLGLHPMPERSELKAVTTGIIEDNDIAIERIYFQSLPGLYVTANLYRPKAITQPLPAVLYVCGHGQVKIDGQSMGNKTHYQHHGIWFATHNYICLTIDTIQLGEIEGMHHGLYSFDRWDWPSRGYTPAGVEAWNSIRAIDYLVSRSEVDANRIGITGRSGGGAYSWYAAAIDPRISVAAPVAGITDLQDHILGNCISGHCDCMYFVNRYGWDFQTLAAMVTPRSLLIVNTDEDPIFPLPGVERIHAQVNHLYRLNGSKKLGIHWTTGGHDDTQELQLGTFVWFDRFLKGQREVIHDAAEKRFNPTDLRVFDQLPLDERVTTVQDWFVPQAQVDPPANPEDWLAMKESIVREIESSVQGRLPFGPENSRNFSDSMVTPLWRSEDENSFIKCVDVTVPPESTCRVITVAPAGNQSVRSIVAVIPDKAIWEKLSPLLDPELASKKSRDVKAIFEICNTEQADNICLAIITPEATGPWHWDSSSKAGLHLRRSFLLAGWSIEGRQIAGTNFALDYLNAEYPDAACELRGFNSTSLMALHAGILRRGHLNKVVLHSVPESYRDGFVLLGVLQHFDLPQTIAALADQVFVELHDSALDLNFARAISVIQKWPDNRLIQVESSDSQ